MTSHNKGTYRCFYCIRAMLNKKKISIQILVGTQILSGVKYYTMITDGLKHRLDLWNFNCIIPFVTTAKIATGEKK